MPFLAGEIDLAVAGNGRPCGGKELLPVVDNLERALASAQHGHAAADIDHRILDQVIHGDRSQDAQADAAQVGDQAVVDRLQSGRPVLQDRRDGVGGQVDVGVAEHQQHPRRRTVDKLTSRFEDERAGALGADQGLGQVEAALRQQLVEVEAGDPPGDVGVARPDRLGVAVP